MDNLVVYKNDMNLVPMRHFNAVELDLFFSICAKMRDKKLDLIEFTFDELKHLSDYKATAKSRFADDIESVYRKFLTLQFHKRDKHHRIGFVLFTDYDIDIDNEIVKIRTNQKFEYILNVLSNEFTKFELEEFTSLKSSYSKTMYRLLKQFRTTGYAVFEIDVFKELLCVPESYQQHHINQRILQPIKNELELHFKHLQIHKISKGRTRKITHIEFTFEAEIDINASGSGTFRDKDGFHYNKPLEDFNDEEVNKKFVPAPEPMSERYDKEVIAKKEEMKKKWLEMFPEDANMFK